MPISTFEEMVGTWFYSQGPRAKFQIFENGEVVWSPDIDDYRPMAIWFEEGHLHVLGGENDTCPEGTIGIYDVSGVPGLKLIFTVVEDPCFSDRGLRGKWEPASAF
jgi:hypothetical protein